MTLPSGIPAPAQAHVHGEAVPALNGSVGAQALRGGSRLVGDGHGDRLGKGVRGGDGEGVRLQGDGPLCDGAPANFAGRVRQGFGRGAASYEAHARLQQGVAWRLARFCRDLPLPSGLSADLGAGKIGRAHV